LIDQGSLNEAERQLAILERNRTMELSVVTKTGQASANIRNLTGGGIDPRSVTPAPPAVGINPLGATTVAPAATGSGGTTTPIVIPVMFQLPTAAAVARRIGPVRIPLFVQANLLADRRINGNL
jgi:hypothetical protein